MTMMTHDLTIERLVADLAPVRPRSWQRDLGLLAAIGVVELLLVLWLAARVDLADAMAGPVIWWKLAVAGLLTLSCIGAAIASLDPLASPRPGLVAAGAVAVAGLAAGWVIDINIAKPLGLVERLDWRDGLSCLVELAALSLPAMAGLAVLVQQGAPRDTRRTARVAGFGAAAWAAFVFAFVCPHDDPVYVALWYTMGCALIALGGGWLLARRARW